jgi:hypothetical protein
MLGTDYSELFRALTRQVEWNVEIPGDRERFFRETGHIPSVPDEDRRSPRLRVRTQCLVVPEEPLPAFPRGREPVSAYTADLSRHGIGFLSALQFLPEETVRILLPVFWMQVKIVRGRRLSTNCYAGCGLLLRKHPPDLSAFKGIAIPR